MKKLDKYVIGWFGPVLSTRIVKSRRFEVMGPGVVFPVLLAMMSALVALAQKPVASTPVLSSPVGVASTVRMEAETVEITDGGAYPPVITRKGGPFILHLVNRTRRTPPDLEWAVAAGALLKSTLTAAANPAVLAGLPRQLSVLNLPVGQYLLQTKTGKVFLTITIR